MPRPPPGLPTPRRRWATVVAGAVLVAALATGCIGQRSRNDDHVGPYSPRPDAREHIL